MQTLIKKDQYRRKIFLKNELYRNILKIFLNKQNLSKQLRYKVFIRFWAYPLEGSKTRIKNRCVITGRSRSVFRKFHLSRLMFRKYATQGQILGLRKKY